MFTIQDFDQLTALNSIEQMLKYAASKCDYPQPKSMYVFPTSNRLSLTAMQVEVTEHFGLIRLSTENGLNFLLEFKNFVENKIVI